MPRKSLITQQHVPDEMRQRAEFMRRNMTPVEAKLWQRLRAGRLEGFHFRRQQVIDGYIVDFYCHTAGLVVEVDGEFHVEREAYDRERDLHLAGYGLRVLRFDNTQVEGEIEAVLAAIWEACQAGEGEV
jgi:very-short-patch-repair endonuclease